MSGKELETRQDSGIQVIDLSQAKMAMAAFQKFKAEVLTEDDFYTMSGDPKKIRHVKKSGWMKYAMALGITTEVYGEVCSSIKFKGEDVLLYNFTAKAVAPNGRFAEAVGSASSDEGKPWASAIHSIRAMAQTRAVERAISNLIGGGEVGAEEMDTKTVDAEYRVKYANPSAAVHDQHDEDAAISLEQDIIDGLTQGGLDPNGVEITRGRDYGVFIIKKNWPADAPQDTWGKYHEHLKPFGAKYRGKDEANPEYRGNWTIGV